MRLLKFMVILLVLTGCEDQGIPPEVRPSTIHLTVEDYGTNDAWLRVLFTDPPPYAFRLVRDGQMVLDVLSSTADTVVSDESLMPNRNYTYAAFRLSGTSVIDSSQPMQLTTLDTSSSAWQWALDTLGVAYSYLIDCEIIAPDNIWVVGELFDTLSNGQLDPILCNAAHWDGTRWNIIRVPYVYQGSPTYSSIRTLFAFNANDIWFSNSVRWNGQQFQNVNLAIPIFSGVAINKICGNPTTGELYVVGNSGTIAYSPDHGTTWQRQESGTTQYLSDVFGTSVNNIYISGMSPSVGRGIVLRKVDKSWQTMIVSESFDTTGFLQTKLYGSIDGLWQDERRTLYTVGNLMFRHKHGKWDYVRSLPGNCLGCNPNYLYNGYLHAVRGNCSNDMFIAGEFNTLRHFNGVSWIEVGMPYYPLNYDLDWYSVHVKGNTAISVGTIWQNSNRGIVMRLWR